MGLFVAAPLIAAVVATAWPAARHAMLSPPLPLMVGLNIGRVAGVLFLLLAAEGGCQVLSLIPPAGATSLPAPSRCRSCG